MCDDHDPADHYSPNAVDGCYVWCSDCGIRLKKDEVIGWGCPKCGNEGVPCDPDKDVCVEINWLELRVLGVWAENYARQCEQAGSATGLSKTVKAICRRLEHQWPDLTPLTLSGELAELPERLAEAGISVGSVGSNVPPEAPFLTLGPGAVGFGKQPPEEAPTTDF